MSPWEADWALRSTTIELYCPTCGKAVFVDEADAEAGCPVCSSPLMRPVDRAFIDLTKATPAIVLG